MYTSALESIAASRNGVPDPLSSHGTNMDAHENNVMGGNLVENKGGEIANLEARILVNRATVRCLSLWNTNTRTICVAFAVFLK